MVIFLGGRGGGLGGLNINSLRSKRGVQKTQMSKPSNPIQEDLVGFHMSFNQNRFKKCNLIEFG